MVLTEEQINSMSDEELRANAHCLLEKLCETQEQAEQFAKESLVRQGSGEWGVSDVMRIMGFLDSSLSDDPDTNIAAASPVLGMVLFEVWGDSSE